MSWKHATPVWLALLLLVAAPFGSVAAQQGEDQGEDDESEYEQNVEVSDDEATITVKRETPEEEAKLAINFKTETAGYEVSFERENSTSEAEQTLEARFHQIVEYVDENDNGQYDEGEEIASSWKLAEDAEEIVQGPDNGTVTWDALSQNQTETEDGTEGTFINGTATFRSEDDPLGGIGGDLLPTPDNSTFSLDMYVFKNATTFEGSELKPTQVKIDIGISNYPYARNDTALAVIMDTKAENELELDDEEGVTSSADLEDIEAKLEFTWKDTAMVDGTEEPVHTTTFDEEQENETEDGEAESEVQRTFALSYARGEEIVHDPRTGGTLDVQGSTVDDVRDEVPAPGIVAVMAAIGLAGLAIRRRR